MKYKLTLFLLFFILCFQFSFSQETNDARVLYLRGVQSLVNNDLQNAEKLFNQVLSLPKAQDKYKAKAIYFLGDIYFIYQNYIKSISYYQIVVQKYQNDTIYSKGLYKLGRTLIIADRVDEGIAILNDYIGKYENIDKLADAALYWIARGQFKKKNYEEAKRILDSVLNKYPNSSYAYEIRNNLIPNILALIEEENKKKLQLAAVTNELNQLKTRNQELIMEKDLLKRMTDLLIIKQKLIDLKAEKISLLAEIKLMREITE